MKKSKSNTQLKKIVVTGAAGFIGSHLVEALLDLGVLVTAVDDFSRGTHDNLPNHKNLTIVEVDLRKDINLDTVFAGHDAVVNLAALNTGVDYDLGRTEVMFEDNMLLQMIPIKVAARVGIKHFIQISSASVYTKHAMEQIIPTPEGADTSDPEPSKLGYALAKKMGENLAVWYSQNTSMRTVRVRFINVYGQRDNFDEMGHFIPVMIKKFLDSKNKQINVFGSGKQRRSFLHVADAVSALLLLLKKGKNGDVYNVDANNEQSVAEVVSKINKLFGGDFSINFDTTKPEGSKRRLLDSSKLLKLGWSPKIAFDEGLRLTVDDIKRRVQNAKKVG